MKRCSRRAREAIGTIDEPIESRSVSPAEAYWRELAGKPKPGLWHEPLAPELTDGGKVRMTAKGYAGRKRGWIGAMGEGSDEL